MYYRNDGSDEINAVQNQFTAYLTKALRNARAQYIRSKVRRLQVELALDEMEYLGITAESQMEQLADAQDLFAALQIMKEKERYVLLARVIEEKGFDVIAAELGMSYKGAAAIYYRTLEKLRRILGGDGNEIYAVDGTGKSRRFRRCYRAFDDVQAVAFERGNSGQQFG